MEKNDMALPKAIVFRDSFFENVIPHFSEHFNYVKYYWQYWGSDTLVVEMVDSAKPDIVVEEMVERCIKNNIPDFRESPPEFLANDLFHNGKELFSLKMINSIDELELNKELIIGLKSRNLLLNSTGNDPYLILPKLNLISQKNKEYMLKLECSSEIDTTFQLFYKNDSTEDYTEKNSIRKHINKGKNRFYAYLPYKALIHKIRIDPSTTKGKIIITKIEIKEVANINSKSFWAFRHYPRFCHSTRVLRYAGSLPMNKRIDFPVTG